MFKSLILTLLVFCAIFFVGAMSLMLYSLNRSQDTATSNRFNTMGFGCAVVSIASLVLVQLVLTAQLFSE